MESIVIDVDNEDTSSTKRMYNSSNKTFLSEIDGSKVVLIYPMVMDRETYRQTTIYNGDAERTFAPNLLNDSLVEFALTHFILENSESDDFYNFDPIFITQLRKYSHLTPLERYSNVRNMTGMISIFSKDFLLIPVNVDNIHWFSIVVIRAASIFNPISPVDVQRPCILVMDSLCSRKTIQNYSTDIKLLSEYLIMEWMHSSCQSLQRKHFDSAYKLELNKFKLLTSFLLPTPQQPNDYDCGFYMIRNLINIVKYRPHTYASVFDDEFAEFLSETFFNHLEICSDREYLRTVISSMILEYRDFEGSKVVASRIITEDINLEI